MEVADYIGVDYTSISSPLICKTCGKPHGICTATLGDVRLRDHVFAAASTPAQAEPTPVSAWQPMETAPKDGTEILLTGGKNSGRWVRTAWWARRTEHWCVDTVAGVNLGDPTGWSPLPSPPDAPESGGQ
jgi:hypothetical protein